MSLWWQTLNQWFSANETALFWIGVGSAVMLVGSIAALPWLVGRIPGDYFTHQQPPTPLPFKGHPLLGFSFHLLRNLLALVLIMIPNNRVNRPCPGADCCRFFDAIPARARSIDSVIRYHDEPFSGKIQGGTVVYPTTRHIKCPQLVSPKRGTYATTNRRD